MTRPSPARLVAASLVLATGVGCARTPPEQQLIDRVARALGGTQQVLDVTSLRIEGQGDTFALGQSRVVGGEPPRYAVSNHVRRFDFARNRSRVEQMRTPAFLTSNTATVRQYIALDGEVAFTVSESGVVERQQPWVARERRAELRQTPIGIVRAALATGTTLSSLRVEDDRDLIDITENDGVTYTLFADRTTHLPTKVRVLTAHPNLGDITLETEFEQYEAVGEMQMPTIYTTRMDGVVTARISVSTTTLNAGVEDLVAPPPIVSTDPNPPRPTVRAEQVAPGLWYLTGQSHHSVVAEFSDHLTLVEAPLNEARTLAVIQKARELRPGKPLTQVIPSHHHFDHSAGIRAAVAEGLTVIVPAATRAFFEDILNRPHQLVPDALAASRKPAQFDTFEQDLVLEDSAMTLRLMLIEGSPHADPFVMVYFPKQRALYEADAFTPAAEGDKAPPSAPFAKSLLDTIEKRGLKVERLLAGHGRMAAMKDLEAAASATAPSAAPTPRPTAP